MSIFSGIFRGREPTNKRGEASAKSMENMLQMITLYGEQYYAWDGKLYDSDIVRACIRPKVKAVGKLVGRHIKKTVEGGLAVNAEPRLRFLLEEPNPYMTLQMLLEKMTTQLCLNHNSFALIIRDEYGYPIQVYPIPTVMAEAIYDDQSNLYLRFTYKNGTQTVFPYEDIIHLRSDFCEHEVFGSSPAPVLSQLMECVGTVDQGLVKAVKNSNLIRWLLEFNGSMRPEDIKKQTKEFVDSYLSYETDTFGVAAVDQKVNAKQVQPNDYVPNSAIMNGVTDRIYSFFNINKSIVQSDYDEDQWNAFYESEIEPIAEQLSTVFTIKLFTRRERAIGNKIMFESANLAYASMKTKLNLTQFLDRGIMNVNEIREILSLGSIEGGDVYVRRLDTAPIGVDPVGVEEESKEENTEEGGVTDVKNRREGKNRTE